MYHQTIEMMRFLTTPLLNELRRRLPLVSTVANKHLPITSLLPPHHSATPRRPLYTGATLRKDVPLPQSKADQTEEKLDLDIWKSVMRLQVPGVEEEEKLGGEEGGGDCAAGGVTGQEEISPLEATRELVVMWRHAGKLVPETMTDEELGILAELQTKSSKKKYLKYLAVKEGHKKSHKQKQEKKKAERSERIQEDDRIRPGGLRGGGEEEGELRNTFLLQFWGRSLDKLLGWRSAQAMVFGQPLVFDMSYEQQMTRREVENTVSQLMEVEGWNRRAADPFHLHFCNLQPDGGYRRELVKRYGAEAWERLLVTSTERRHVDLFPRDDLVYLTADSPNVLRTFDNSKVYIVGSMVDRSIQSGLSLANAKRLKLNTARLPLDDFLQWETGAKNLTLDQMVRILLTLKERGRWEEALEHVPKRKHDGFYQEKPQQDRDRGSDKDRRFFSGRTRGDTGFRAGDRDCDRTFRSGDRERSFSRRDSVLKSGDSDRSIRTGDRGDRDRDRDRSIRTGDRGDRDRERDSDRSIRTGDREGDRAIRTGDRGDRDSMEEWRQRQMNVVVRERGSTSRHKDSVFSSRDRGDRDRDSTEERRHKDSVFSSRDRGDRDRDSTEERRHKDSVFSSRDRVTVSKEAGPTGDSEDRQNTQTTTRLRTSLKSKMEDRNSTAKSGKK